MHRNIALYLVVLEKNTIFAKNIIIKGMAQKIAIFNGKGGVGKTTTTLNLGTALWLLNKRVLLVDCDPQCNLSVTLDKTSFAPSMYTLYEWLKEKDYSNEIPTYERYNGLDYIPASPKMEEINRWLVERPRREDYITNRIKLIESNYDYILFDCAPAVESLLNMNVMVCADAVIIPTRADFYGIQSQGPVSLKLEEVREVFQKELPVLGYLLTQSEKTRTGKDILGYLRGMEGAHVFRPIRKCNACCGGQPLQMSLFEFDSASTAADDYMMLAEEIIGRKVRPKSWIPVEWGRKAKKAYDEFIKIQEEEA